MVWVLLVIVAGWWLAALVAFALLRAASVADARARPATVEEPGAMEGETAARAAGA